MRFSSDRPGARSDRPGTESDPAGAGSGRPAPDAATCGTREHHEAAVPAERLVDEAHLSPPGDATIGLQIMPWVDFDQADEIVADVLTHIENQPGIRYEVGTMETVLTGPLDQLLELVGQCLRLAHRAGAGEVLAITKILYQPTQKGCRLP